MHDIEQRRAALVNVGGWIALRATLVVLGVVALVWLATQIASVLLLVFLASILAAGALGPASWLREHGVPEPLAVVGTYLAVAAILVVAVLLIVPPVVTQIGDLVKAAPDTVSGVVDRLRPVLAPFGIKVSSSNLSSLATSQLQSLSGALSILPFMVFSTVADLLAVVFLSVFLLLERHAARRWVFRFVAPSDRESLQHLTDQAALKLGAYIRGQLIIMTVTGIADAIGLMLLGVPFPVALGVLAFLTEIIPLAGPFISGAVILGFALLQSPAQAVGALVLIIAVQELEGLVLVPQVHGRVVAISPAVALVAVLSGAAVDGIPGAFVSIPVVALSTVVLEEIVLPWRRREIADAEGVKTSADGVRSAP